MVDRDLDTGLDVPQRTLVRAAMVTRLAPLLRANGGYLADVRPLSSAIRAGSDDELDRLHHEAGAAPCVLVACGLKSYVESGQGSPRDQYQTQLELHVYVMSRNLRSHLARVAGDVGSDAALTADPGIEVMLEQVEELLIGFHPADGAGTSSTLYRLVPQSEDEVHQDVDTLLWRQTYSLRMQRELHRHTAAGPITTVRGRHLVAGAETQNPLITTETDLS
jgi:hypothetical protein